MKIEVVRQKRKTICLNVENSEKAVLKVPMRISDKKIEQFLESKQAWLHKTCAKMKENENFEATLCANEKAYLNGKFAGDFSKLIPKFENMTSKMQATAIKKFYLSKFSELEKRANELSKATGIGFLCVKPTKSHRIWGSFNRKGEMKLNVFLVALPSELVDYVIVHELCHSLQMNHSPKFWANVCRFLPDYKVRKAELAKFGFLLKM